MTAVLNSSLFQFLASPRAAALVVLLGVLGFSWQGWALYQWQQDQLPAFDQPQAPSDPLAASAPPAGMDPSPVLAAQLFGEADAEASLPSTEALPETRLQLVLKGAFTSTDPQQASAFIADETDRTQRYFINDPLPGNAVLEAVKPDAVVIRRGGQLETLSFPKITSDQVASVQLQPSQGAAPVNPGQRNRPDGAPPRGFNPSSIPINNNPQLSASIKKRLEAIRSRLKQQQATPQNADNDD